MRDGEIKKMHTLVRGVKPQQQKLGFLVGSPNAAVAGKACKKKKEQRGI